MHKLPTMYTAKKANTTAPRFMCSESRTASSKSSEYCSSSPSQPIIPSGSRKSWPIKSPIRDHGAVKALSNIPVTKPRVEASRDLDALKVQAPGIIERPGGGFRLFYTAVGPGKP